MPIAPLWSVIGLQQKVRALISEGVPQKQAVAVALAMGRAAWRKRFPRKPFPSAIALPKASPGGAAKAARPKRAKNPVPASSRVRLQEATQLYEDFTGHEGEVIAEVERPEYPSELAVIGEIDAVAYTTHREGRKEKYLHKFHHKAKPLFCVNHDGTQIFLVGGEYDFTNRGIVDRTDPAQQ